MNLNDTVDKINGVGISYLKKLEKLKIKTIKDLLYHIPTRYIDYSLTTTISSLQEGEIVTLRGKIKEIKNHYIKGRPLTIQKAILTDSTGSVSITWFNQPYLVKNLKGKLISISGKVTRFGKKLNLESPEFEIVQTGKTIHTGRLVPVYPETGGLSSKWLRRKIADVLAKVEIIDTLPEYIEKENNLTDLKTALHFIHLPNNREQVEAAKKRLAFEELLYLQLLNYLRKKQWQKRKLTMKIEIKKNLPKIIQFIRNLPFELTNAQKKAVKEILADLSKATPMNRLLQGDVGSGKTAVAAIAIYASYLNGYKSLLMAPTEILTQQHYQTLNRLFSRYKIKIALQTSSFKKNLQKNHLIVGTHALLYSKKEFEKVALVVIDEQHRFGVEQRALLRELEINPHFLTMTATPIPRTIALTLYGELAMSIIDEMPKGRKIVKTFVIPEFKYQAAYQWIKERITKAKEKGVIEQAYIIYPLIEESEILTEVKAAKKEYERLKREIFPNLNLGLLHGKLPVSEKNEVMEKFRQGKIDILVSTSVVEVGMDIPNATIILIENADRFGLAQLHQLRGRVGRNDRESYCFLFSQTKGTRLKALEKHYSGLKLAEIDLKIRGAGEIYGTKQHGLPELKFADLSNLNLIEKTRKKAEEILNKDPELKNHPFLKEKIIPFIKKHVQPD